jgi:hypothetical protein
MNDICIITPCMGRLKHLQQSLAASALQPGCTTVVVDYSCPEHSGDWVEQNVPQAQVVRVPGAQWFSISRSRNAGVRGAPASGWLCFVDADVVLAADFAAKLRPLLQPGSFGVVQPWVRELTGFLACARGDFERIGGYDEIIQGWGYEDVDLISRLRWAGLTMRGVPADWLTSIPHEDALRTCHYAEKDIAVSETVNFLYARAKFDLMRVLGRELRQEERVALYTQAGETLQRYRANPRDDTWRLFYRREGMRLGIEISACLTYILSATPPRNV